MSVSTDLKVELLPPEASDDQHTMTHLAEMVNRVYATAEHGLWLPGATRTNVDEIKEFTKAGQIVVARIGTLIVGSIRVQQLDPNTAETGMLVADPRFRNIGIGRELRRFVIDMLRGRGVKSLQIELLVPREGTQESKKFMAEWNERSGYKVVRRGSLQEQYPALAPQLAVPCDFIIYNKDL
ncbi:GNAT family N-acetyltransferase [Amycolatopsis sp. NPDC058986]|uniref:GNAT family N-acetyltransferase n=1 Tax=unclassified Amycolatopsis TaxID=2618356 RepID=UPI00366D59DB